MRQLGVLPVLLYRHLGVLPVQLLWTAVHLLQSLLLPRSSLRADGALLVQPSATHGAILEPASAAKGAAAARIAAGNRIVVLEGPYAGCVGAIEKVMF